MIIEKNRPLISVVMPVYNAAAFLPQAIDCILQQSFEDFELILINDGSSDNSSEIIKSYCDKRIRFFEQENQGVAKTLNTALNCVRGKYIWRHDADDTCLPDKLATQVTFLEAHPEFALCGTQIAFMTERGKIAWEYCRPRGDFFGGKEFAEVTRQQFNPYSPITHATVLIRTEVLKALGGYREAFKTAEDVDLWLRLLGDYRAAILNHCDYHVRLNRTSATYVHGWRNEFYRNLAFLYYEQRAMSGADDLMSGKEIILPDSSPETRITSHSKGRITRHDLLDYFYPLHINARDYAESFKIARYAIRDGWKLYSTWKAIIFPILGKRVVDFCIKLKRRIW